MFGNPNNLNPYDNHTHSQIVSVHGGKEQAPACCEPKQVFVMASHWTDIVHGYSAAVAAFLVAASSSRVLGKLFPRLSQKLLPQVTGYLVIRVIVGPYVTNLIKILSHFLIRQQPDVPCSLPAVHPGLHLLHTRLLALSLLGSPHQCGTTIAAVSES